VWLLQRGKKGLADAMSSGGYYNRAVAEWARQNIRGRVEVRPLFRSRAGVILTYSLLFCVPAAFFALGLVMLALGARDRHTVVAPFVFGFLTLIPCGLIALVGGYVRRGFAKSLDAEGVSGSFGQRFSWWKLYYVDHVTKRYVAGGVPRRIKDNQLELVFEGGKLVIPPMIHDRAAVWASSTACRPRSGTTASGAHTTGAQHDRRVSNTIK
jgi:hypothetical protein